MFDRSEVSLRDRRGELERFGPYRVIERIASGGMAEIYKVVHRAAPNEPYALKRIRPDCDEDPEFRRMLMDEAKIASILNHPNISGVLEVVLEDGHLGLILDFVDGHDLGALKKHLRDRDTTFSLELCIHIVKKVLDGLDYAHNAKDADDEYLNIVHRDISPGNVMVNIHGQVKIVDFGIARAQNRLAKTEAGNVKGKFRYMSPEQIKGDFTGPATDVYSTAVLLWELLAGKRIYDDVSVAQLMIRVANAQVPSLNDARRGLPKSLHKVFRKATALEAGERYASARAFADALDSVLHEYDSERCRRELENLVREVKQRETTGKFQQAVARARIAAENDLEDAILSALEDPDRVEKFGGEAHRAEPITGTIPLDLPGRADSRPPA
jgi:serine/threonine-protein kinase